MKKITFDDFERNHIKNSNRWLSWLPICMMLLFGPFTLLYGQGNTCNNPLTITSLPYTLSGNTSSYGNDYSSSDIPPAIPGVIGVGLPSTYYLGGDDVVFAITPSIAGQMTVIASDLGTWSGMYVFTGCAFAATVGHVSSLDAGTKEIPAIPVTANTTYYIVISTWPTPDSTPFTLNVTGTPGLLTPPETCAGMPEGGTATLTPATGNAGATFLAKATGVTIASGLDYQWQKNIGGTWQDIANATTVNTSLTAEAGAVGTTTDYRLKVTCTALDLTNYSTTATYTVSLVYCTSVPTSNDNSGITNVILGTSSFPVADVTYYNHPTTVNLIAGITNQALITFATGYTYHTNIWIDLNDNGTFDSNELVFQGESTNANPTVFNASFLLDQGAAVGLHKMRIGTADSGQSTPNPCYSGGYGVTIDVMVNVVPPPACLPPSALTAINVTSNSADLSWTSTGTLFDIEWGPQGFTQESGTLVTGVSVPYTLSLPSSNTSYSYYVRRDCGATYGLSFWSGPYTFKTACAPTTAFEENFDSYTLTGGSNPLPSCWSRVGNTGNSYITTGSGAPMSGTNRLYLNANSTDATKAIAVMPQVSNLQAGTHRLKFKAYSSLAGRSLEVGYYESADDPESYNYLETFEMPSTSLSSTLEFSYSPPMSIPAGVQTLVFMLDGAAYEGSTTIYIDDVKWEPIPPCGDIFASDITFSNIGTASVDVEWYTGGSETAWQYVYTSDASVTDPSTLTPVNEVSNTPFTTITSLQSNTNYKFWVRSNCGSGSVGIWSGVRTFTTACAPVTVFPYVIDFESVTVPAIPNCTSLENAGTGNNWKTANVTSNGFSGKVLNYPYNSANAANAWFYTNQITLEAGITYKLTYKYGNDYSFYTEKLKVSYGTFASSDDMINELADHPSINTGIAQDNSVSFTPTVTGNYVIGFNAYSTSNQNSLYVDNIIVDLAPTASPVCATNIVAVTNATCGNYATTITWTASPSAEGYNVTIAPTAGGDSTTTDVGNVTTFSHVGNHNTEYTFTVVPYNNIGDTVGCVAQTFTTALDGCYCPSVPTSNDGAGISNVLIGSQNFPTGDVMYFDHTATPADLAQGILSNVKVTLATGYSYHSNVWIDLNDNYIFEAEELLYSIPTAELSPYPNPNITDASFEMPVNAPLGMHRMRIVSTDVVQTVANPCYNGSYGVTLDFMVNITPAPSCLAPTNASATNITTTSVTLNWTASITAAANGYDYYVTTSTTPPTAATVPTGTVGAGITTAEVSALASSTVHYFYVRSVCSASDVSAWTQSGTFTTLCDTAPLPYLIDFENATVPNLPLCTVNQNVGTGNDWKTFSGTNSGFTGKFLRYTYNSTNPANTWFFTNTFNLVAGTTYSVSYKYGAGSTTYTEKLKVAYGTAANDAAMTTILANHENVNSNVPQNNTVEFTPATSGSYVIGFNAYSPANGLYLQLDNILIQEALGTSDFDSNNFVAYPNPVKDKLTIRYNQTISDVTVFNLLGQQLFSNSINATEGKIDMSNLASGNYLVKVTSGDKVQTIKVIKE